MGWVARYWKDLPDKPRLSSPVSIEGHLRQRGLLESQEGLAGAWAVVTDEYRQQRLVAAASDAGVTPEQLAASIERHPSGHDYAQQEPLPGMADLPLPAAEPVTLELLDHKLTMIMTALGIKGGLRPEHAMIMPPVPPEPIDWAQLWADAQAEQAAGE